MNYKPLVSRFNDKVVIVTGSGSGRGEATARRFSAEGAKLVLVGRNKSKLDRVARDLPAQRTLVQRGDVAQFAQVRRVVNAAVKEFGQIDVLVNNAGVAVEGDIAKMKQRDWDKVMNTNARGVFNGCQSVLPHLVMKTKATRKGNFLPENGLSLVWLGLFFLSFIIGQTIFGQKEYNDDRRAHGHAEVTLVEYVTTPHFLEATMENWESEFLQMFLFITLTAFLYQKGSAESKKLDEAEPMDRDPRHVKVTKNAPWPVKKGGWILKLYENSLSIAFLILFLACFYMHALGGAQHYNEEQRDHGETEQLTTIQYMGTSRFWFESFQNWQSEFLAVGMMVLLSIWLRQRGSPESKPVDAPHDQTGKS